MSGWQVKLEKFPPKEIESFSRIWRKHDHSRYEESIYAALIELSRGKVESQIIARYEDKESVERVLAEIENLRGEGSLEESSES